MYTHTLVFFQPQSGNFPWTETSMDVLWGTEVLVLGCCQCAART